LKITNCCSAVQSITDHCAEYNELWIMKPDSLSLSLSILQSHALTLNKTEREREKRREKFSEDHDHEGGCGV
jgi:hypothetical protein